MAKILRHWIKPWCFHILLSGLSSQSSSTSPQNKTENKLCCYYYYYYKPSPCELPEIFMSCLESNKTDQFSDILVYPAEMPRFGTLGALASFSSSYFCTYSVNMLVCCGTVYRKEPAALICLEFLQWGFCGGKEMKDENVDRGSVHGADDALFVSP